MRLLILSFYYPPDLSAGSFRMRGLTAALEAFRDAGLEVDIITTRPNRYASFRSEAPDHEDHGWLRITRLTLPSHANGMIDQARSFVAYARQVRRLTARGEWDAVFATSSRLMTAALGAHVARRRDLPLYLDIRDLFTDTMRDVFAGRPQRHAIPVFDWLERRTFRRADRLTIVSPGFRDHIGAVAPALSPGVFTNGIDADFLAHDYTGAAAQDGPPLVLYAGNIGAGQGLHRIIPGAARRMDGGARFTVIGDGGAAGALRAAVTPDLERHIDLRPPVQRDALIADYARADILFLHLNDFPAFRKVLPSKIFEYAATGKPIVAGVAGEAAGFLRREVPHAHVFDPCDVEGCAAALRRALEGPAIVDRAAFCDAYARDRIMARMAQDIVGLMRAAPG